MLAVAPFKCKLGTCVAGIMMKTGAVCQSCSPSSTVQLCCSRHSRTLEWKSNKRWLGLLEPGFSHRRQVHSEARACVNVNPKQPRRLKAVEAKSIDVVEGTEKSLGITNGALARNLVIGVEVPPLFLPNENVEGCSDPEDDEVALELETIGVINANGEVAGTPGDVCVVGIDPDVSGAIAVLKEQGTQAEVIDVPCVKVMVGKTMRRRHDAHSIVTMMHQLNAPQGSVAYVEQAMPFAKDGKQGWYGTGFGYGVWVGILMALGFRVVPVRAQTWKAAMGIAGREYSKDDSRALASSLFPALSPQLRRKKDHGRAEALLIAAFGKGYIPTPPF